ncbi:MAG: hypothetical protein QXQ38_04095, partial [Archaeoglobaceae archaeon]
MTLRMIESAAGIDASFNTGFQTTGSTFSRARTMSVPTESAGITTRIPSRRPKGAIHGLKFLTTTSSFSSPAATQDIMPS